LKIVLQTEGVTLII